ncbi:Fibronectin-binding protein A N-terminus (FbpA) [uncultured Clostridium sp.]|nr:Fibronectin-binding protein A N-terminus (FbpA) [uncultured Clostridium sp.]
MALDGLVIHSLVDELSSKLIGGKVDKVHQPEDDEIVLYIRNNKENYKLILSCSSSNPRVYIANDYKKENPKKAPMFCMLFRKYIQSGNIVDISQVGFERIIKISVDSLDELKEKTTKDIYIEIMGRHSNIILTHNEDNKIIDSAKRIPTSISRVRQILPGLTYELPPAQDKLNPLNSISKDEFIEALKSYDGPVFKSIYSKFLGISPVISKEICYRAKLNEKINISDLSNEELISLFNEFNSLFNDIRNNKFSPCIVLNEKIDRVLDFSCINLSLYNEFKFIIKKSMSTVLEDYYKNKDIKDRIHQRASDLKKSISIKLERLYHKQEKQSEELEEANNAESYKIKGELLTAYIYMIQKGMESIDVQNFYDPNYESVTIPLRKNLTPSENSQRYFKKYNKLKTAKKEITSQMAINKEEIDYLENILLNIENCENLAELQDIKDELVSLGYSKASGKLKSKKEIAKLITSPHEFISSEGIRILVGKNNKQNDHLTLRIADPEDIWMHTKNIPGSHVIIKCAGKDISEQTIYEGAMLAAYFSKAKSSSKVPVDYTKKKHVKKPSGSKPGMVIYETNNTMYVDPNEEMVASLKNKEI